MKAGFIPPVHPASGGLAGTGSKDGGNPYPSMPETMGQTGPETDAVVVSITGEGADEEAPCLPLEVDDAELKQFLRLLEESNRQIEEAIRFWAPLTPKPVNVPSALGLTVGAASGRLSGAGLNVRQVKREYSENVPAGHVVSQVPAPGGASTKEYGVTLIVSKGPPPEKERYDLVKRQERVPFLRIRSKEQQAQPGASGLPASEMPAVAEIDGSIVL